MKITKQLLKDKIASLSDTEQTFQKECSEQFEKLIKKISNEDNLKASIRVSVFSRSIDCYYEIKVLGKIDHETISGYIQDDKLTMSLAILMNSSDDTYNLQKRRIYLCAKVYDKEQSIVDWWKTKKKTITKIHEQLYDCRNELEQIEYDERVAERRNKQEFVVSNMRRYGAVGWLRVVQIMYGVNNYKVEIQDKLNFIKETEKLLVLSQYGSEKRYQKWDIINKFDSCVFIEGNIIHFNKLHIERIHKVIDELVDDAIYDLENQKLILKTDDDTKEYLLDSKTYWLVSYIVYGSQYDLEEYRKATKDE